MRMTAPKTAGRYMRSAHQNCDIRLRYHQALVKGGEPETMLPGKTGEIGIGYLLVPKYPTPIGATHVDVSRDENMA